MKKNLVLIADIALLALIFLLGLALGAIIDYHSADFTMTDKQAAKFCAHQPIKPRGEPLIINQK